ncbi:MAG: LysM peptidoglycan-binding domain-containing protein [Spirochaetaceae bacterium]|nr:LysM peptidoglycan-binding domain-containing protein [Spirochaetaceae bacterium]
MRKGKRRAAAILVLAAGAAGLAANPVAAAKAPSGPLPAGPAPAALAAVQSVAPAAPPRQAAVPAIPPAEEMPAASFTRSRPMPPPPDAAPPALQGHAEEARYGIDMPWGEERFEAFRAAYLSDGGKAWLEAIMRRAAPYLPYVAERLRYYNLPEELAFLPVIESEYSAKAVSRSGAAGLWQFMKNSIGGYGMRIDDWVDERRDFMKSTDGALRKLADNYAYFGDWPLALAAYNAGLGAVSRAVKKAGGTPGRPEASSDYWELRRRGLLSRETMGYVPKFLAAASILRYPARHGLSASWEEPAAWEAVETRRPVDLAILSEAAGLPMETLKAANAELRYGVTPPYAGYRVKVPASAAPAARALLEDESRKLVRYYLHKVRSGDTLSALSRHYGTPQGMILQSNPGLRADLLKIGQLLVVPALKEAGPPPAPERPEGAAVDFSGSYVVKKGDSLWGIALRHEVQPEVLAERNGMSLESVIREGMVLRVPILE